MEILNQISLFLGICVAIYGINSWRREHVGKRQLELTEDTLALFYEAADAIRHMRHPASFGEEREAVERADSESDAQFQARKDASVIFHRYNQHQELFNKIHASRYRFMAQIGKEKSKPFEDLRGIVNEIVAAARTLSRLWARDHFRTDEQ
jgi:spore coat polysaccharide biosynthesis predicted glycosyltransferase SpsG